MKRGRNHRGRRRCSNSASNHWLGTESYSTERTKDPASPNTTLLGEVGSVGTVRIVGRLRSDLPESTPNAITFEPPHSRQLYRGESGEALASVVRGPLPYRRSVVR